MQPEPPVEVLAIAEPAPEAVVQAKTVAARPPERVVKKPVERKKQVKPKAAPKQIAPAAAAAISPSLSQDGAESKAAKGAIKCTIPEANYPARAERLGQTGTVRVRLTMGASGRVEQAVVVRGSGIESLDNAALSAARRGRCSNAPAGITRVVPITFQELK